jgi:hypothetical protein
VIGKVFAVGSAAPYRHPKVWARETANGPERLRIGAGLGTMQLYWALAAELAEPLFVRVVLIAPREGDAGTFESREVSRLDVSRFLERFSDLFEDDARAQLVLGERGGHGLLFLDEHDLIYAYGALHRFEEILRERGYAAGDPTVPERHEHRSSAAFDPLERELRSWWDWERVESLPGERLLRPAAE